MDDCSPDGTAEVAKSFHDKRVRYLRNDTALGVCGNFNKGILLSQGEYVWMILADDPLRREHALQTFVDFMDRHRTAGYAFCPAVMLEGDQETTVPERMRHGLHDRLLKGEEFFKRLQRSYCLSCSVMIRRECFRLGMLPVDLEFGGQWFLWCLLALHYDVGYLAEPMVNQRFHEHYITRTAGRGLLETCRDMSIEARWRVLAAAKAISSPSLVKSCLEGIATDYIGRLEARLRRDATDGLDLEEFEQSLQRSRATADEQRILRARIYHVAGDLFYSQGDFAKARACYSTALRQRWNVRCCAKYVLLSTGKWGILFRDRLRGTERSRLAHPSELGG